MIRPMRIFRQVLLVFLAVVIPIGARAQDMAVTDFGFGKVQILGQFEISEKEPGIFLPVTVGGQTVDFLLDTAAAHTVFDRSVDVPLGGSLGEAVTRAGGEQLRVDVYPPVEIKLGGLAAGSDRIGRADLGSLGRKFGRSVSGVLGNTFIRRYIWVINFEGLLLVCKRVSGAKPLRENFTGFTLFAKVVDKMERFEIDTGLPANASLKGELFDALVTRGNIRPVVDPVKEGAAATMGRGLLDRMVIGKRPFERKIVQRRNENHIGLEFLKKFVVFLDPGKGAATLVNRESIKASETTADDGGPDREENAGPAPSQ